MPRCTISLSQDNEPARSDDVMPTDAAAVGVSDLKVHDQARPARLRVGYYPIASLPEFPGGILAEIRFGSLPSANNAAVCSDSASHLCINVELEPLAATPAVVEIWEAQGPVEYGRDGAVRYAHDDQHLFAVVELDERQHSGIQGAAEFVYAELCRFQCASPFPHVLRMWNYADAVNVGAGDLERYRQFCVGRARGLGESLTETYPAASALGRQHSTHSLQVYWLAGRIAGTAVENPRQVSAYRYPHMYGPVSPGFARATLAPDGTLLISGTASILGHASHHIGDVTAQLDETLRNLDALIAEAARHRPALPAALAPQTFLKVYVRDQTQASVICAHLRNRLPDAKAMFLAADICRRELLVEIECVQGAR